MAVKYDFSDVDGFFEEGYEELNEDVGKIGEDAVKHAIEHKGYQNRTHRLVNGNRFEVDKKGGLSLYNIMYYAPYVEARGYNVLGDSLLYAWNRLNKEIK
mgnify:CR=1 FL=1